MPSLLARGFRDDDTPCLWECSGCGSIFSLKRNSAKPSSSELHEVDSDFREHCEKTHPGTAIAGFIASTKYPTKYD